MCSWNSIITHYCNILRSVERKLLANVFLQIQNIYCLINRTNAPPIKNALLPYCQCLCIRMNVIRWYRSVTIRIKDGKVLSTTVLYYCLYFSITMIILGHLYILGNSTSLRSKATTGWSPRPRGKTITWPWGGLKSSDWIYGTGWTRRTQWIRWIRRLWRL